jgi:hypothetical protein
MSHVCKFGDRFCGRFGVSSLCSYCKRSYDLELAAQENEMNGARAQQNRESREAANEALGQFVVEHPVATFGTLLGILGVSAAVKSYKSRPEPKVSPRMRIHGHKK